ncbi:hypothetical protein I3842_15G114300 [Carya illinoinensis]|uniref:GH18 domain-containing protein n=1 Tax=Carya illinoinensis TaxID=32201 RepID=A0A922D272_CARIL|nr:hypothetical protein I3842_15G114300 [Carya illinoinensis]
MASSASPVVVKAGYWFFGHDLNRKVAEIPSELFTHLYACFAEVDDDGRLIIPEPYSEPFRDFTKTVRVRNPSVKTLLSIGGEGPNISTAIASVARDDKLRDAFINRSIQLAREYNYDGLDLCWLYPSKADQEEQLASLLNEWRSALDLDFTKTKKPANKLLLTAAVFHHPGIPGKDGNITFNYPIPAINKNLDWINVLAIDFYTPSPSNSSRETGPVHAWRNPKEPNRCGSDGIRNWINGIGPNPVKIDAQKLVLGLPFYGYQWTLVNHDDHGFFAAADPANAAAAARLEFRIIQEKHINRNAGRLVNDHDEYGASYWHHEASWIGFEDEHSIATKVKEAFRGNNLGGYFAWHLAADDDNWILSNAASNALDNAMNNPSVTWQSLLEKGILVMILPLLVLLLPPLLLLLLQILRLLLLLIYVTYYKLLA